MNGLVTCPKCNGADINMTEDPHTEHTPGSHNWWGQQHKVSIPLQCECGHEFNLVITGYKNRVCTQGSVSCVCSDCGGVIPSNDEKCSSCFYFPDDKP